MGIVYEAEHCMLARPAAIKLIQLDETTDDPESLSQRSLKLNRFEKEAQATARLESPHTIGIYDFGRVPTVASIMSWSFFTEPTSQH